MARWTFGLEPMAVVLFAQKPCLVVVYLFMVYSICVKNSGISSKSVNSFLLNGNIFSLSLSWEKRKNKHKERPVNVVSMVTVVVFYTSSSLGKIPWKRHNQKGDTQPDCEK